MKNRHEVRRGLALMAVVLPAGFAPALPDVEEIGRILGYPGSELVATDVTAQEREIHSLQTASEEELGLAPPIKPERIYSAYRITGRTPESFLPILITVADEGTFLGPEVRDILEQLAAVPRANLMKQNAEHLGAFEMNGGSEGGIIVGKLRRPSKFEETQAPGNAMATISEVTHPREGIDIRVAMHFTHEQGGNVDMVEMPGGARYFAYFREYGGPFEGTSPETPTFDWLEAFKDLNQVALKAYKASQKSTTPEASSRETSDMLVGSYSPKAVSGSVNRNVGRDKVDGESWSMVMMMFVVTGAIVLVLLVALVKRKLE